MDARSGLQKLAGYPYQILSWVSRDGYPLSAPVMARIDAGAATASFPAPVGLDILTDGEVSLTGSHIHPQPGYGYDERRHVTVWGRVSPVDDGRLQLQATVAWGWDEAEVPFFEYSERSVGQSRRYFDALSAERGTPVKPRLSFGALVLRTTRLPFLTATMVPVLLGLAIAATDGYFELWSALLTIVGAACVQLGLNVTNDVFDTLQGADDANVNPTKYSGGSRVLQYGLVSMRRMIALAGSFYAIAAVIGIVLLATRGSPALLAIGLLGFIVSIGYTAPPLKLVYRGLGEIAVAVGFGPMMLLGAYVVQSGGRISTAAVLASLPVAILVALILYVNEIPDRRGDARAGKRTLPVRLPKDAVVNGYLVAAAIAFALVIGGVVLGLLPIPALVVLVAAPLVGRVYDGIKTYYEQPYGLMAVMAVNIQVHLLVGALLLAAYLLVLAARALAPGVPLFLR